MWTEQFDDETEPADIGSGTEPAYADLPSTEPIDLTGVMRAMGNGSV